MTEQNKQTGRQMRFTPDELSLLKATFRDNEALILLLRKVFLPELDPNAPIGQVVDLWMVKDYGTMSPEDVKIHVIARKDLILHVEQQLMQLQVLSQQREETAEEVIARIEKNSAK